MRKKVFITGEQGNLAYYLSRMFDDEHFEIVWSYQRQIRAFCNRKALFGSELDITDIKAVRGALGFTNPDIIIHTAAVVGTERCSNFEFEAFATNVLGTYNILKSMQQKTKMVYFSTTATYKPTKFLITESSERDPQTVYGKTKYIGELLVKQMATKPLIILPCFIFGGERDYTVSAIARLARNFNLRNPRVEILNLNLEKKKDYMYVTDFVEAVYQLVKKNVTGEYNISAGRPLAFGYILRDIIRRGLMQYELRSGEDYLGDHIVGNEKLRKAIPKWRPVVTLGEGIDKVFNEDAKR
jgi:dTDP-4-dehydrorhamnose reductase